MKYFWGIVLVSYALLTASIFSLCCMLLIRLSLPEYGPPGNILLAICILITIGTIFTYVLGPVSIVCLQRGIWTAPNKNILIRYFTVRMLFFLVTLAAAWQTYRAVKNEGHRAALLWAFILENTMLFSLITSLSILATQLQMTP